MGTKIPYAEIFPITEASHPQMDLVKRSCECWKKYLLDFQKKFPLEVPPYIDNEMSAVGSLAAGMSRYDKECFVVHEAAIVKNGNNTSAGRCDLYAYFTENDVLCFEAKRHRKNFRIEKLIDVFAEEEKEGNPNIRSLIGKGLRDHAKSTGNIHKIRKRNGENRVMLLITNPIISNNKIPNDISKEIKDNLKKVFSSSISVRTTEGNISKKNLSKFPTIGFVYIPKSDDPVNTVALVAAMTLL